MMNVVLRKSVCIECSRSEMKQVGEELVCRIDYVVNRFESKKVV
jgi:hypothetical protein